MIDSGVKGFMDVSPADSAPTRGLTAAFKVAVILGAVILGQAIFIAWLLLQHSSGGDEYDLSRPIPENIIRTTYPDIDFSPMYPTRSSEEIEELQRVGFGQRFLYEPFVQFKMEPCTAPSVEITEAGFRSGPKTQPWPCPDEDRSVFVFGGSTTFGYGVGPEDTFVHALQLEISRQSPGSEVQCYNFGCGYYISAQEAALFESLLRKGHVPDLAIFVDGLNDHIFYDGQPNFSRRIAAFFAPDLETAPLAQTHEKAEAERLLDGMHERFRRGIRTVEAVANEHGVAVIFVGQPVPFLDYEKTERSYPFARPFGGAAMAKWGYPRFARKAAAGEFGENFVWCGDVFSGTREPMYVDSIHYSAAAGRIFAEAIVTRAGERGLLPE